MLTSWAAQKRQILAGTNRGGDQAGWSGASILEKIKRLGDGAGQAQGSTRQQFAEVLRGDALLIARGMEGMPAELRDVIHLHHIIDGSVAWKAEQWGWSTSAYWRHLDNGYSYLAGRLDATAEQCHARGG